MEGIINTCNSGVVKFTDSKDINHENSILDKVESKEKNADIKNTEIGDTRVISKNGLGELDGIRDIKLLSILYFNARSIKNKLDELKYLVKEKSPDVIAIVESWLNEDIFDSEVAIENYNFVRLDRKSEEKVKGGGIIIYINQELTHLNMNFDQINNIDFGWVKIHGSGIKTVVIGVFYRPPDCNEEQLQNLIGIMSKFKTTRTVLIGDFNFRNINWRNHTTGKIGKKFLKVIDSLALTQCVKQKTRGDGLLDLVLVYEKHFLYNIEYLPPIGKSDHDTLFITLKAKVSLPIKAVQVYNYNKANYKILDNLIKAVDWEVEINKLSVNEYWSKLIQLLNEFKENHIPKLKRKDKTEVPWITDSIKKTIKKRNNLYKRFKRTGYCHFRIKYKQIRNKVTKLIKLAKGKHESKIIKRSRNNRKIFYAYINSKNRKRNGHKIGPLIRSGVDNKGEVIEDDKEIAILLNEQFCSVFNKEVKTVNQSMLINYRSQGRFLNNIHISVDDVTKAISEFKPNKSPGIDNITSTYALKITDMVAYPLYLLFNKSIETNEIPNDWKKANVTPIFKKGKKSSAENYRPISLTTFYGKVMEKVIKKKIETYLEINGFIATTQHGFRSGRSCLTNLLISQFCIMKMIDENSAVDMIFLDFQKAFDKVPHGNLMKKVRSFGIEGKLGDWMENWLTNREQRVVVNGSCSDWARVESGVPQGSILGPLLFTLYINDIDTDLKNSILKFADDTKIWGEVNSNEDKIKMHDDLRRLERWSDENKMPFNVDKCKVMHVGKKNPKEVYKLNEKVLLEVKEEKDLGVFVTENLKPSVNCNRVCKSAIKIIGLINRNIVNKSREGMLILYKTMIRPLVDYCIPFWRPYTKKDIGNLEKVQKRFTKMITGCKGKQYKQRLEILKLTTLEERHERADLIQVYKVLNDNKYIYPDGFLVLSEREGRGNCKKLFKKRNRLEVSRNSFTSRVVDKWNALPDGVVLADDLNDFKGKLDKYMRGVRGRH